MPYAAQYDLATDATFLKQILIAMMNQCAVVLSESAATAGHPERTLYAVQVIANPTAFSPKVAFAVMTQAGIVPQTVPSTVTDAAVQAAVAAVWSAMAGYFVH